MKFTKEIRNDKDGTLLDELVMQYCDDWVVNSIEEKDGVTKVIFENIDSGDRINHTRF